jgi:uncharacterized protein
MNLDDRQNNTSIRSLRRIVLSILTVFVLIKLIFSLIATIDRPQIQGKFELYQTNLVLEASAWQPTDNDAGLGELQKAIVGTDVLKSAIEQYQTARETDLKTIAKFKEDLAQFEATAVANKIDKAVKLEIATTERTIAAAKSEIDAIDLRIGILQASQDRSDEAIATWEKVRADGLQSRSKNLATTLIDLWEKSPEIDTTTAPKIAADIKSSFDGWFRDRVLTRLYDNLGDEQQLDRLDRAEQTKAKNAAIALIVNTIPRVILGLVGVGLIVWLTISTLIRIARKPATRSVADVVLENINTPWTTPWNWEIVWQVLMLGFFFVGQFLLPFLFSNFVSPAQLTARGQGFYVLSSYVSMAGLCLGVLYLSIKNYLPLPADWFNFNWRSNWALWGIGGYLVATPIVIVVSILNERIWQGQGGSNPILQIVLEGKDPIAPWLFFLTAAVAAPIFEEFLFRGFLLPSLTRYVPVWAAIGLSGLLFGVAHLSMSEIIPLTTLGIILGIVYTRTRNLLASMLLHSLWNSSTLVSLFILGSSN